VLATSVHFNENSQWNNYSQVVQNIHCSISTMLWFCDSMLEFNTKCSYLYESAGIVPTRSK